MSCLNSSAQRDKGCNDGYIIDYFQSRGRHFKRYNVIAITLGYILSLSHNALTLCTNVIASISYCSRLSEALSVLAVIDLSLSALLFLLLVIALPLLCICFLPYPIIFFTDLEGDFKYFRRQYSKYEPHMYTFKTRFSQRFV